MATPQPGIFAQGTRSHRHLEFDLRPGTAPAALLAALQPLRQPSTTAGGVNIVLGFGPTAWRTLAPLHAPADVADFPVLAVLSAGLFLADGTSATTLNGSITSVSYTHLRAHETVLDLVCRLLLEKKKTKHHHQYRCNC
mgnify:CR=1 FL=1